MEGGEEGGVVSNEWLRVLAAQHTFKSDTLGIEGFGKETRELNSLGGGRGRFFRERRGRR